MMVADITYDGAALALAHKFPELCPPGHAPPRSAISAAASATVVAPHAGVEHAEGFSFFPSPAGSAMALALKKLSPGGARHRRAGRLLDARDARRSSS